MKHRDKVDLFLTLLAGLPLLASGLFGLTYITSLMLSDYQHALWIAQAMSALLIWIGGYFCYYAWRKRRRILSDYDLLYRHYPELADDWSRLSRQSQVGDEDLGLYCYKDHLVITAIFAPSSKSQPLATRCKRSPSVATSSKPIS